jgi:tetratricopeptide (TPR) repeat protein
LTPQSPLAIRDLGNAMLAAGQFDAATVQFKKVLAIDPSDAPASIALGMTLLLHGDFENGLPLYEQRRRLPTLARFEQNFGKPQWDGGDLTGKRILIHAEQGFGDTIQFMRYIPHVAQRNGRIYFACLPEMTRLLQQFPGIEKFLTSGDEVPDFDVHCSLATLPMILKTTMNTVPADVPYLRADPQLSALWRERIPKSERVNVGLIWAGRPNPDPKRTIPFQLLAPLKECKNARFFSLQIGGPARAVANAEFEITDLSNDLTDLSETAAAMENLDLIITIDTATAHLGGALARPTWTLLPFLADWRWFLNRADSPWYPTMRLFRQPMPGDWKTPIEQVIRALVQFGNA